MKCLALNKPNYHKTGSEFVTSIFGLNNLQREEKFLEALVEGHVPQSMKIFSSITIDFNDNVGNQHSLTLDVLPDYLRIGNDDDSFNVPLWPTTAQTLADMWGCSLPTTRMVTLYWTSSLQKLPPQPWGPPYDATMSSTSRIIKHNERIQNKIKELEFDRTLFLAGHKKDVVITNELAKKPKQVAIFGWHQSNGKNIQQLYLGHENTYSDYSHGIRFTSNDCMLNGEQDNLSRILMDSNLSAGLSDEGSLIVVKQPKA